MEIEADEDGYAIRWVEVEKYSPRKTYTLCRCGGSSNMPYCDGTHVRNEFDGTETSGNQPYLDNTEFFEGQELDLTDNKPLCSKSAFCQRAGGTWDLVKESGDPDKNKLARQQVSDCPSGRLVIWVKEGNQVEPEFEDSIATTEDENGVMGPLWVKGGIQIVSSDGTIYETRNRVTLCSCGKSTRKPFCDSSHLE